MDPSQGGNISGGGGSGEQVRRLHIVYFLSRLGRIEQPHLIRVHHPHRNGVYLRDVKRWLADLRGKDMPESFAWSYKRKYKNGYVWQDLMVDDLITPICDNEYVLKGSEISPSSPIGSNVGTKVSGLKADDRKVQVDAEDNENQEHQTSNLKQLEEASPREDHSYPRISAPRKTSAEIHQESSVSSSNGSTLTEDYIKQEGEEEEEEEEEEKETNLNKDKPRQERDKLENFSSSSFYTIFLGDKKNKTKKKTGNDNCSNDNNIDKVDTPSSSFSSSSSSSQPLFSRSKSYSSGASSIFRNLMNCGAIDTNDAGLVETNKLGSIKPRNHNNVDNFHNKAEVSVKNSLGGSSKGTWNQQPHQQSAWKSFDGFKASKKQQHTSGVANPTTIVPAAYQPISAPNCSQCGKLFKPEKLHFHMKSCKGMKAFTKGGPASQKKMPFHKSADLLYENQLVAIF